MRLLKAVIFDMDGTLADTERDGHRVAFNAAFRDFGLDWHWDEVSYGGLLAIGGGKERIRHYAVSKGLPLVVSNGFDAWVTELHATKTRHFQALLASRGIPPRPGVVRLLRELCDAGVRLAIATTSAPDAVITLLHTSLPEFSAEGFAVIGAGDAVPAKKPAPDIYQWVLERLDLPACACMAVEDSPIGLAASLSAGLKTLVTVNAYTAGQDFPGATAVISDLGEPGRPFRVLQGDAHGRGYVDLALLEAWLKDMP